MSQCSKSLLSCCMVICFATLHILIMAARHSTLLTAFSQNVIIFMFLCTVPSHQHQELPKAQLVQGMSFLTHTPFPLPLTFPAPPPCDNDNIVNHIYSRSSAAGPQPNQVHNTCIKLQYHRINDTRPVYVERLWRNFLKQGSRLTYR